MEPIPLIPKPKFFPNIDTSPLLRELFQNEFQSVIPMQKLSQNIATSFQYHTENGTEINKELEYLTILSKTRGQLKVFAENVLKAYKNHQEKLDNIRDAEENIFEVHTDYLKRERTVLDNKRLQELMNLKRFPLFQAVNKTFVEKYKLLEGDAGLPPKFAAVSDFRVMNFKKWRRNFDSLNQDTIVLNCNKKCLTFQNGRSKLPAKVSGEKIRKPRPKKQKFSKKEVKIFEANPKTVFFTDFKLGEVYKTNILVKNVCHKTLQFSIKPMNPNGPFKVQIKEKSGAKILPGLNFHLIVEFRPKSVDNAAEDVVIVAEEGNRLLIPVVACLEPPILKTHKEVNEFTKVTTEKIASSYIECGECFTGDSKVTKVRFRSYGGAGEFFIMSSENWNRSYINSVTVDNLLEIPPFRVYPVFFKMQKDEVIDLFVEFLPKTSGTHVEKIMIACDNGELASLDLMGDAVGWHSYYFTFQDTLLKELPVNKEDDIKAKYYLDFEDSLPNEKVERIFYICNNSTMSFDFQWKIREANISNNADDYLKIPKNQVKIDPESGTFDSNSIWEFLVTITLNNADIGSYRMVLSLFVLNLPCQCIEEDNTVIQPTGLVRNLYSQSLYGEEECTPELMSLQGTYETLQESIKTYVECQNKAQSLPKNDFCKTTCSMTPGLCAKPLKKSKTFFNIGESIDEEIFSCVCRPRPETESLSEYCHSSEKFHDSGSPLKNEVTWDFVDILVDEIELWVDVISPRVTLEPSVMVLPSLIEVNRPPVCRKIKIINHNRSLVKCSWFKLVKSQNSNTVTRVIIPDSNVKNSTNTSSGSDTVNEPEFLDNESESEAKTIGSEEKKEIKESYRITIDPNKNFKVPGLSEFCCIIGISASQPGNIEEKILLSVNNEDFEIELLIFANAVVTHFETSPQILDFGALRIGGRYSGDFQIINKTLGPLYWQIKQYKYNFSEKKFLNFHGKKGSSNLKNESGTIEKEGCCIREKFYFDARVKGIKCSILEINASKSEPNSSMKQYILTLGEVKMPEMRLCAPTFEDAILAIPGKMYVGQSVSTKVILSNVGIVKTFFTWGHSFGCHCRKLKIKICPKSGLIQSSRKLMIQIDITPLDEGIISHCYIPCFFWRRTEPLILSVVGVVEKLNVTFEIIDYPKQIHADPSNFLKSPFYHTVLRIPWPVKSYNATLNLNYLPQENVENMKCLCSEVEQEANRAFPDIHNCEEPSESEKNLIDIDELSEDKTKSPSRKTSKTQSNEDFKLSVIDKKKSEENSLVLNSSRVSIHEFAQYSKPELDFSDIPYRTPVLRQFAIRNETSITTTFKVRAFKFGINTNQSDRRLEKIKRKVFGISDEYEDKLATDQPLVLIIEPSKGNLEGFDAVGINVTAYGNTWGEYRDCLLCEINGIETFFLKIFIRIVGHPINFPGISFQPRYKPILRFEPISWISLPVSKKIKVVNRSAVPLSLSWIVFLTEPLSNEEGEGSCNSYETQANLESNNSGMESTKSSKNYLPKNASDSGLPFRNMLEARDFSDSATLESFAKTESSSEKKEKIEMFNEDKSFGIPSLTEEEKSQVQQLPFPGRLDNHIFQVEPKEMFFEPFEERKVTITFNPGLYSSKHSSQEFKGVLTGCVKLKPEDERCPGIYYRPCGTNFVSEMLDFNAFVETPLLSFEIVKRDLKFTMDSNAVIKSSSKTQIQSRKFLIKNNNQNSIKIKIETIPGVIFKVTKVDTLNKFYPEYNPDKHIIIIGPKQSIEMELTCTVTYKDVMYAYEQLIQNKKKSKPSISENLTGKCTSEKESSKTDREPWHQYFDYVSEEKIHNIKFSVGYKDSLELHLNRLSSKSNHSACYDTHDILPEAEGEFYPIWDEVETSSKKENLHISVVREELNFIQPGLITQTLSPELHLSFPVIKFSSKNFDFGNVYIGESAIRYCSLINLTGFSTEFRIKAKSNNDDFTVNPVSGNIPPSNYNSDIGITIAIEFRPSEPGLSKQTFHVFCNLDMEFDFYELYVAGLGSWNEKHKQPKFETHATLSSYCQIQK